MRTRLAVITGMLALGVVLMTMVLMAPAPAWASNPSPAAAASKTDSAAAREVVPQLLSSRELAEVARNAEEPGDEVLGGSLSNLHLTYIVIALAAILLVILVRR